jgi:hypothetical protein
MSINSEFRKANNPTASIAMQHYIFAFVQDVINQPDNLERSINWLMEYCEKEKMNYSELSQQLNSFFQLLEEYRKTNTFVLYRFLKLQAQACFIDEERFELLKIRPAKQEVSDEIPDLCASSCGNSSISSSHNGGIVGGHIIGL